MKQIVRFAPSPTNNNDDKNARGLHIGSLRTILFNYLFAKQNDGLFICRIEDTDEERSNDDCLKCMIRDWEWAGINFDAGFKMDGEKVVQFNNTGIDFGSLKQSQRKDRYNTYTDCLLKQNKAYEKEGAIFFRMPKEDVVFFDAVLGELTLPRDDTQDFVIRKSSGMPSFYMAMTCDDQDMGVTTIIRGFEHINTNYRQIALQKALGFRQIQTAHIPLIFNPDGSKMSKRQTSGQVNVWDFRNDGYLSQAILNYISMLGWNPGKNQEFFNLDFMIKNFSLMSINKNNPRFDYKKLDSLNAQHLRSLDKDQLGKELSKFDSSFSTGSMDNIHNVILPRSKTLKDIINNSQFFIQDDVSYNVDDCTKHIDKNILMEAQARLQKVRGWSKDNLLKAVDDVVKSQNSTIGKVSMALRVALTGCGKSPPIDDTMILIGKDRSMKRIAKCV